MLAGNDCGKVVNERESIWKRRKRKEEVPTPITLPP
jgi:hypothetical protein